MSDKRIPTQAQIERGAAALCSFWDGSVDYSWDEIPEQNKGHWHAQSEAVLKAALGGEQKARGSE